MRWNKLISLALTLGLSLCCGAEEVLVTGSPASPSFLKDVLRARGWESFPPAPLRPGQSWSLPDGKRVINVDWTPPPASVAALSDHPEEVDRRGMLFSGGLVPQRPVRLQFYHLGSLPGAAPEIALWVTNPGSEGATLHLSQAAGKPSLDYFSTGHGNNVDWFSRQVANEGEFLNLAPGETRVLYRHAMPLHHVISGTLGLSQMEGPPLQFGLLASPDPADAPSMNNLLKEKDVHSRGFYPVATQHFQRQHVVGQGESKIAVGALRQETFSGVRELRGDYGVLYDMEIELSNPHESPATVSLLFNPRGGAATATFLWNDQTIEVPLTQAFAEATIGTVELAPRSSQTVRLQTIPEGASSYPIRVVIRD